MFDFGGHVLALALASRTFFNCICSISVMMPSYVTSIIGGSPASFFLSCSASYHLSKSVSVMSSSSSITNSLTAFLICSDK